MSSQSNDRSIDYIEFVVSDIARSRDFYGYELAVWRIFDSLAAVLVDSSS